MSAEDYHGFHKWIDERLGHRWGEAVYSFVACLLSLVVSGLAAYLSKEPLLFPSLGPTAFLSFENPMAPISSPRNTLIGHLVAILAGALSLGIFGLLGGASILTEGVTPARIGAGALSVALTGGVLLLMRSSHPPAGATTLIVSLGLLQTPREMLVLMIGAVLLTAVGWTINRALGVPMPLWAPREG